MNKNRHPIIAGNWKMHGTKQSVSQLLTAFKNKIKFNDPVEMIVFPPFTFLGEAEQLLIDSPIHWGGQNIAAETQGAFTGEISAAMLREFGCQYALVGHSERRQLYGESDAIIAKKYKLALEANLQPILCLGETLEQRKKDQTAAVVTEQLSRILAHMGGAHALSDVIIAYEPVWAIGTGLTATPEQAQEVHAHLRQTIASQDADLASRARILYGGSVKASNAAALFAMADIDGGLIGGASLDAQEFLQIYQAAENICSN
jgi:triosephosphate isomerase